MEAVDEIVITKKPRRGRKRRPLGGRRKTAKKNGAAKQKPAPAAKTRAKNPARSPVIPPVPATVLGLVDVDGVRRSARLEQHQAARGSVVDCNPPRQSATKALPNTNQHDQTILEGKNGA
ncbi:hypothetical protein RvY_18707 [Ramazzottius varieornatus]|uniref:Uncharacterized protein n=1 Tax=Ramazzottius varieornatus TaxID=947166 RepID=A0A1D1W6U3_RAMVA|nr:hypothetical protein RvY_18707 [Ramazzottius varieornatus]